MQFAYPQLLILLLLTPGICLLAKHGNNKLDQEIQSLGKLSDKQFFIINKTRRLRTILLCLFTVFAIIALARPQGESKSIEVSRIGADIAIAVDVSKSMNATDYSPSRLIVSKRKLLDLLNILRGDRVSLVAFAGVAFIETPLSLDYATFRQFVNLLDSSLIPVSGTNLQLAIEKSLQSLRRPEVNNTISSSAAIILISDGEDFGAGLAEAIRMAQEADVPVFALGIGSKEGSSIPEGDTIKTHSNGEAVITRLQDSGLQLLANKTGGQYLQASLTNQDVEYLYTQHIRRLVNAEELDSMNTTVANEWFQLPLSIAVIILIALLLIESSRDARRIRGIRQTSSKTLLVLGLFASMLNPLSTQEALAISQDELNKIGKKAAEGFAAGDYESAAAIFGQASEAPLLEGQGNAFYRLGKYDEAAYAYESAAKKYKNPADKARVLYNKGNALVQQNEYYEAITSYQQSLELSGADDETRSNLEYAKKLLEDEQEPEKPKGQEKEEKEQSEEEQSQGGSAGSQSQTEQEKEDDTKSSGENEKSQDQSESSKSADEDKEDDKKEESEDEQSKEQQQSEPQEKQKNKQDAQSPQQEDSNEQQSAELNAKNISDKQMMKILDGVVERPHSLGKFRAKKAMEELESKGIRPLSDGW